VKGIRPQVISRQSRKILAAPARRPAKRGHGCAFRIPHAKRSSASLRSTNTEKHPSWVFFCICAPGGIRTPNNCFEGRHDIHFTTGATTDTRTVPEPLTKTNAYRQKPLGGLPAERIEFLLQAHKTSVIVALATTPSVFWSFATKFYPFHQSLFL
jgi:hypothetical protein